MLYFLRTKSFWSAPLHSAFNVYISNLFFILNKIGIGGYVEDNVFYKAYVNVDSVLKILRIKSYLNGLTILN